MGVWASAEFDDHEQVCHFTDAGTGLHAIVAIHSTALGPAAGGTRFKPYESPAQALDDALRLSRAMSYKSALAGLPVGGGKAVIIGDPTTLKTRALLLSYARFIDRIGGTFATGEDVGMSVADLEVMNEVTPYVGGTSSHLGAPSIHTATTVMHGLRAVLRHQFQRDDFQDVSVAVQGLGAVGWRLAELLQAAGARLVVADTRAEVVETARQRLGARPTSTDTIHEAEVDIYAPCALGGVINESTVPRIRARAVAGSANNQLASPAAGAALHARGILYAPDYIINAGGIVSGLAGVGAMPGRPKVELQPLDLRLAAIHDRLLDVFDRARSERKPPEIIAERMARELIGRSEAA